MTATLLFPGQSSRRTGMLARAESLAPKTNSVLLDAASEILGRDLRAWDRADPRRAFALNRDVQVGVFVANHLHLQALVARGIEVESSAGLSLGEYNHLVHIGALEFTEALRVVEGRGDAYDRGPSGAMAAVFPVSAEEVEEVLGQVEGFVAISNQNSPTQQVIAGESAAVYAALERLSEELFVDGRVIEKRIPMHCARFKPTATAFKPVLQTPHWQPPTRPYRPNVLGRTLKDCTETEMIELLTRHVYQPVLWHQTINTLIEADPAVLFVEVGPATVVHDLLQRSWTLAPRAHTADLQALNHAVEALRA